MWDNNTESTNNTLYSRGEEWFAGPFGSPVPKLSEIVKWEQNKALYKLLTKQFPRIQAQKQLEDLSAIAKAWTKREVKQRQTFKSTSSSENVAPMVFQLDCDGRWVEYALRLRALQKTKFSNLADEKAGDKPDLVSPQRQDRQMEQWINDADNPVTLAIKPILVHYCQLTESDVLYVLELLRVYDAARCYFVQWVIDEEMKLLVNSTRQARLHKSLTCTYADVGKEILTTLVDLQTQARLLAFTNRRRKNDCSANLWASTRMTERAQMEDKLSPLPHHPPRRSVDASSGGAHVRPRAQHVRLTHYHRRPRCRRSQHGQTNVDPGHGEDSN